MLEPKIKALINIFIHLKIKTMKQLNFGEAIEAMKQGKCLFRLSWDSNDHWFVFKQISSTIKQEIVPKMQSVPDAAKKLFLQSFEDGDFDFISYCGQMLLVNVYHTIDTYTPTNEDIFANDWVIVE